jgi:hypothetical protein
LPEPSEITLEIMRAKLGGGKALCVVMAGRTSFQETFVRAAFPPECTTDEFFNDYIVPNGRNSNLIERLFDKAAEYRYLLYAWNGLRSMPASVKRKYAGAAFEGQTPREVVNLFKRWLLGK